MATAGALEDLPSAYNLNIDYVNGPDIGVNNSVAIPRLWRGQHVVYLDVASNCSVAGENPRWAEVVDGTEASVLAFSVTCTTKPPSNSPWDNY
ncbi:MAG TPA: hypothetical protein VM166_03950 [Gemmatimonadaceae bacterium]|nr:hypothetical protein [Gemmatimonadaceae bacterium]